MPFASGAGTRVAYVAETEFGVTPPTPAFQEMRVTSSGLKTTKATGVSKELSALRDVMDVTLLGIDSAGDLSFELSYGSFDDLMAAALFGEWDADVLKNGSVRQSFTVEETLDLGDGVKSYHRFPGTMINKMALKVASRETFSGSFSVMSVREEVEDDVITGATYADANTEPVSTASANVAALTITGFPPPLVKSLTCDVDNALRTRTVVGSLYSEEFGYGSFSVAGTIEAYFQTNAAYKAALEHGTASLSFVVGNAPGKKYRFTIPRLRFADSSKTIGGSDSDVMVSLPYQGILSAADGCTLKIERGVT